MKSQFGLLFFSIIFFCVSCNQEILKNPKRERERTETVIVNEEDDYEEEDYEEEDYEEEVICYDTADDYRDLSIQDDSFISSNNVSQYRLRGRCGEEDRSISIEVNGRPISKNPVCDKTRWKVNLDLSAVAQSDGRVVFKASHADNTVCIEVRVAFLGPENYIPVPGLEDYYENGFFVMKYEAKIDERGSTQAKAVSKAEDRPFTQASYPEAIKLCRNNGPGYDLMENSQWQNIALSIEDNPINWSNGRANASDGNSLNCGVTSGIPREASSNDLDDCSSFSCDPDWDFKRRTHILSNGQTIWDMCGNAPEMMKDKYTQNESFQGEIYKLTSKLKKIFGPKRKYQSTTGSTRRNESWGLGYAEIKADKDLIVRGGSGRSAGLFSVNVSTTQDSRSSSRRNGFRCVYIP